MLLDSYSVMESMVKSNAVLALFWSCCRCCCCTLFFDSDDDCCFDIIVIDDDDDDDGGGGGDDDCKDLILCGPFFFSFKYALSIVKEVFNSLRVVM